MLLLSSAGCTKCEVLKRLLSAQGVEFQEYDAARVRDGDYPMSDDMLDCLAAMSQHMSLPVLIRRGAPAKNIASEYMVQQ